MKTRNKNNSHRRKSRRSNSNGRLASFQLLEDRRMLATFTVTNTAPSGPGSLPQAVLDANSVAGADTINFDASVFTGGDASLIRLTNGELNITESLTISAPSSLGVTITGDANGDDITTTGNITDVSASFGGTAGAADDLLDDNSRVLNFTASSGDLALEGLTITGGRSTGDIFSGGGINARGSLTLIDSTVSGNSVGSRGGGIYSSSSLTLTNSTVSENSADSGGGGIYSRSSLTLTNSTVSGNTSNAPGGGLFSYGVITLNNSTVSGNTAASRGGGVYSFIGEVILNNSTVSDNSTTSVLTYGGGIAATRTVTLTNNSTVSGNTASSGGGIHSSANVIVTDSTVSGNTGGGINLNSAFMSSLSVTLTNSSVSENTGFGIQTFNSNTTLTNSTVSGNTGIGIQTTSGDATLTNSTVSGNTGGGIRTNFGEVSLTNSTISGNTSIFFTAGGIGTSFRIDRLTIRNSIIAGNSNNGRAPNPELTSTISNLTVQNSIIGDSTGTGLSAGNNNLLDVDFATVLETEVVNGVTVPRLTDNGGPVETIALLANSPAIDAGDNALAVDANGGPLLFDQRGVGFDRIFGGTVDIGAFEAAPSAFLLGDTNQDGVVDFSDIPSFISILQSGDFLDEADINGDGVVDFDDISFFVALLQAQ